MMNAFCKNKATVTRIGDKMFDVRKFIESLGLQKKTVDVNGCQIEMRDKVRWIEVSEFGKYKYKHSLEGSCALEETSNICRHASGTAVTKAEYAYQSCQTL